MEIAGILKDTSEGAWFGIPGTNAEVKIRKLKPYEIRGIRRKCMKWETDGRRTSKELDEDAMNTALLDATVLDWKNIDMNGKPLPVSTENKKLLDDNWDAFSRLWNNTFSDSRGVEETRRGEEVKNS